jgi:ABC-type transport system involved in multi-copper enzyme maturation permease subunit
MSAALVIAGLTIREGIRRNVLIGAAVIGLIILLFGLLRFNSNGAPALQMAQLMGWSGCGMIKFFSSVMAVTLAAGAVSAEIERGLMSTVAPKPLPRSAIYVGKWLGLVAMMATFLAVWGALLIFDVWRDTHIFRPRIIVGILTVGLFPLLFTTVTLFFSSLAGYALSAGLALITAGCSLAESILSTLGTLFSSKALELLSKFVGLLVPLSRMNHWITRGLGDAGMDPTMLANPMGAAPEPATAGDLAYVLVYIAALLIAGCVIFDRRDL